MRLELTEELARVYFSLLEENGDKRAANEIKKQLDRFGAKKITLDASHLSVEDVNVLYEKARETGDQSVMMHITAVRKVLQDPENSTIATLQALEKGLIRYFTSNVIDGWVYQKSDRGFFVAWLLTKVEYHPARNSDERPYVQLTMRANTSASDSDESYSRRNSSSYYSISFSADDIRRKTIPLLLADHMLYHETPELKLEYERHLSLFDKFRPMLNEQFLCSGEAYVNDSSGYWWRRKKVVLQNVRAVNDEGLILRKFTPSASQSFWIDLKEAEITQGTFEEIPYHPFVYMFALEFHDNFWVHVSDMEPYEYDPTIKDKLVLPDEHRDLLDILVTDMDIIIGDIVKGKSGGTTILCKGSPGLGKTLTAECYSEMIGRPLYRVHAGMLGVTAESVEKTLKECFKRSERWGSVLLIDECDVYTRRRGNDITHNAVVASFLRTLEYFSGLLFMTTNRIDDVDDAIESRCIAIITYRPPQAQEARAIWKVLSTQYGATLSDEVLDQLVNHYTVNREPGFQVSGRDIKELLKLAIKFSKGKGVPLDFETFRKCAQFKAL